MKIILLIIGCFTLTAADSINEQWNSFKVAFKKQYSSTKEEDFRLSVFEKNTKEIEEHNAKHARGEVTYTLRINQFADLTVEEFSTKYTGYLMHPPMNRSNLAHKLTYSSNAKFPDSIDWRSKGAVTPVKNQGHCGGCWSFSTTGAMEGQLFQRTGELVPLSEQQLIDCSTGYGNRGCIGGLMDHSFKYIKEVGGMMSEDSYPYRGEDGECIFSEKFVVNGTKVISYAKLSEGNEEDLKAAVATVGPVSVAVKASNPKFMFYNGGILTSDGCGPEFDHAVLVVGYGTKSNIDYWIVKNSWTTNWGEKGYVRIARNRGNVCGVATWGSYPILDEPSPTEPPTTEKPTKKSKAWKTALSSGQLLFASLYFIYYSTKL